MRQRWRIAVERVADVTFRSLGLLALMRDLDSRRAQVVRVLAYHRVNNTACDPLDGHPTILSASPEAFAEQIRLLVRHYTPIGPSALQASLESGRPLPSRSVMVTFDDAYRDFQTDAWPILKAHGVPVVLFVPTDYPDRNRAFWWDELWRMVAQTSRPSLPVDGVGRVDLRSIEGRWTAVRRLQAPLLYQRSEAIERRIEVIRLALDVPSASGSTALGWDELRDLAREGVVIGSHGRSHTSMLALSDPEVVDEIEGSQAVLDREVGSPWRLFAYPFGHTDPRAIPVLRRGRFLAAFGTLPGRNVLPLRDRYAMFRQTVGSEHSFSRMQFGLLGLYPGPLGRLRTSNTFRTS
ncbi:MAG: polysaccharide deacetylase family protein [bacterium]